MNLKAFLSFNRMDVGWSHMFHVYFSSYFLQVKKKDIFVKIVIYLEIFYWQSITSDVSCPESQNTYILNLTSFLLCLQCNTSIERFCRNINAENPSWFGKECPYCLPKGEWEDKFLKPFFLHVNLPFKWTHNKYTGYIHWLFSVCISQVNQMDDVFSIQDPHFWALSRFEPLLTLLYVISFPNRLSWSTLSPPRYCNSLYCLLYNSCVVSLENLALDRLIIPYLYFPIFS